MMSFHTVQAASLQSKFQAEQAFRTKLLAFRRELAEKDRAGETQKPVKKPNEDIWHNTFSGNARLFSVWDSKVSIDVALKELEENFSAIGEFSLDSKIKPEEAIEHFASQYTIYKQHIKKYGSTEQLQALDSILNQYVEKYAKEFSEVVGGFFEDHGMKNERKNMYESFQNRVTRLIDTCENYIKINPDTFQKIVDEAETNGKCAAFEFLAAYKKDGDMETFKPGSRIDYTRKELAGATELVRRANGILNAGAPGIENEEELGVRFGKIALNGFAALGNTSANGEHREVFLNAVKSRIDDLISESDKLLEAKRQETHDEISYAPLERDVIYNIINVMIERYWKTVTGAAQQRLSKLV